MRIFKTKEFARFCRKERITDDVLTATVARAEAGGVDSDLGGGVIKQRIARKGQGKRGGYRVVVFYRTRNRALFVYGFAKNARDNIGEPELNAFRKAAGQALAFNTAAIAELIANGSWLEIDNADEN
jgi:hypothetical protein